MQITEQGKYVFKSRPLAVPRMVWISIASLLIAITAWHPSQSHFWVILAGFIPVLWARARSRTEAALSIAPYLLYATRDAPQILQQFTQISMLACTLILLAYVLTLTALWVAAWHATYSRRQLGLIALSGLTLLPPVGSGVLASPFLASGYLFPNTEALGIVLMVAAWMLADALQHLAKRRLLLITSAALLAALSLALNFFHSQGKPDQRLVAINTQFGKYPDPADTSGRYQRQIEVIALVERMSTLHPEGTIFFLPESIAGRQEPRFEWLWADVAATLKKRSQTLIYGQETVDQDGLLNTAQMIGQHVGQASANTPVPVGSWQPWNSTQHYPARPFAADTLQAAELRMNVFFCWEELVPWPWLHASLRRDRGDIAVVMVNHWFGQGSAAGDAQARSSESWARLFGWNIVRSANQ